jgi:2-polyprenyl-6-hydroxyphenyl methylase/3-demethylubiquinone-9 3-methyltransferase
VADQLLRVCRPGGTIGMITIVPAGLPGDLIEIVERYSPPSPPGVLSPLEWGSENHVRELFGDRVESLELTRKKLVLDCFADPTDLWRYMKANHPLVVGLYQDLADEAARIATLDRGLVEAATRWNLGAPDGPAIYETEYLLVVARKRDSSELRV